MNVYKGRLLKKSSNRKLKLVLSTLVTTWPLNIAFHLRPIWLQTLVAINSEWCKTSFPSFCEPPSKVAVLFNSNLSRRPFLAQVVDFRKMLFCSYVIFLLRDIFFLLRDLWLIERLSEAMGAALVCNNFSPIPSKISCYMKNHFDSSGLFCNQHHLQLLPTMPSVLVSNRRTLSNSRSML